MRPPEALGLTGPSLNTDGLRAVIDLNDQVEGTYQIVPEVTVNVGDGVLVPRLGPGEGVVLSGLPPEGHDVGVEPGRVLYVGKAKTLGERALGHPDPGSISTYLILKFMTEYVSDEKSSS